MKIVNSTISRPRQTINAQVGARTINKKTPQAPSDAKVLQVLIRLPEDLASRLVQVVKPGQRNRYFLDLLRKDLDRESRELEQAAQALSALEAQNAALGQEDAAWLNASLLTDDDDFDAATFERQYHAVRSTQIDSHQTAGSSAAQIVPPKSTRTGRRRRNPLAA